MIQNTLRRSSWRRASFSTNSIPSGQSGSFLPFAFGAVAGAALYSKKNTVLKALSNPMMPVIRLLDPETAHLVAVKCTALGLTPTDDSIDPKSLHVSLLGLKFDNPVGIAAGFDKHAEAMEGLLDMGFGFVEIGSVTPLSQEGNPKPRVFRLSEDRGVINRYGFNSEGIQAVATRLEKYIATRQGIDHRRGPLGVNLGKNKISEDASKDYVLGVETLGPYADYLVINISSPNTPGLRTLQGKKLLHQLLSSVIAARNRLPFKESKIPLFVKIAPDLTADDKKDIAEVALELKVDGLIVSNTTLSRPETLRSENKTQTGGLSGAPVKALSTAVLYDMYKLTKGQIPLIGVGGIGTGEDAYEKIKAGASLVQLYSCLVYDGPMAIVKIKKELQELLEKDGYTNIQQAVGSAHRVKK